MQQDLEKFGRKISPANAPFYDRISSVGRNERGLLTWMASCATEGCDGELPLEMLRRHGNQKCDHCVYTIIFDGERVSKKLEPEKHRIVAVAKIKSVGKYKVKDWWMRCGKSECMNVFRCYDFVRHDVNFCTVHREDRRRRAAFGSLYNYCKAGAMVRKKSWDISLADFRILCKLPFCFYCQSPLDRILNDAVDDNPEQSRIKTRLTMWLDRVDSSTGYEAGNVVPCCRVCNCRKNWRWTGEQMLSVRATERGDADMLDKLARGATWKQLFKSIYAHYLSAAEAKKLCR